VSGARDIAILTQWGGRRAAALDLAVWLGVVALALVGASFGRRLGVPAQAWAMVAAPGQMLVLVIVTTLLLRRRGETWASLGFAGSPVSWPWATSGPWRSTPSGSC
jgi:hypothetical protein